MRFILTLFLLGASCLVQAEVYKWVDEQGKTHYGDRPPAQPSEKLELPERAAPARPAEDERQRSERIKKWVDARQQEREREKQVKDELREKRAAREKACNDLRRELKDLETGGVLWYRLDEAGNRQFYTDAEIEARKQEMRKTLKKQCS